jgi:hypothetical protein
MPKAAVTSSPANIDIQIQRWPIERLKPYEGNARTHSNAQINQIAASMKDRPAACPGGSKRGFKLRGNRRIE